MRIRAFLVFGFLIVSIPILGGCAANHVDLKKMNQLRVETSSTTAVIVQEPSVWLEDGNTVIYGRVARAPGAFMVGDGHTHVQVRLAASGIVEEQWNSWVPKWIPFRNPRYSTYRVTYPWVAPPRSNIRVWVCYTEHTSIPGGNAPARVPAI